MQRPSLLAGLALSALLLSACGGKADPRALLSTGNQDLAQADYSGAEAAFEKALSSIGNDSSNPLYLDLRKGLLLARSATAPKEVTTEIEALADEQGGKVTDGLYSEVAQALATAHQFDEAVAVLTAGTKRFGKTDLLEKQVSQINEMAASAGREDVTKSLDGLGYGGGK